MDDSRPHKPQCEPWPFLGEVEDRLRAVVAEGRAALAAEDAQPPADDAEAEAARRRANRRADRLRMIELARLATTDTLLRTTEYLAGRIDGWQAGNLDRARDPLAAVPALNRSIIQLTLLEERLDESDEERAERIREEAEARAQAERAEEARRWSQAEADREAETKRQVKDTVRALSLACLEPDLGYDDREDLLSEAFFNFELDTGWSWRGDPAELAADILARLDISYIDPSQTDEEGRDPVIRRANLVAGVRDYLDRLAGTAVPDAGDGPMPVTQPLAIPAECAQGPPQTHS